MTGQDLPKIVKWDVEGKMKFMYLNNNNKKIFKMYYI